MRTLLVSAIWLVACGGGGTSGNATEAGVVDGPVAPTMITISGTASSRGLGGTTPVDAATIAAYRNTDEATPVAMTTTNAQGNFSLTFDTGGMALVGFLKATKNGFAATYVYSPDPLAADTTGIPVNMLTSGNYDTIYTITQTSQMANTGTVAVIVRDAAMMPVAGATVSSMPAATYKYNGSNGLPNANASSTQADGTGYMLNAMPGPITVTASKTGLTFRSFPVKAFADSLTTTLIIP